MSIIARDAGREWVNCPEGQFQACCVDVIDKGEIETQFGLKHKIRIMFQVAETDPTTGKPFLVGRNFTLSMNEKAALRQFMESWRGKKYTDAEVKAGVDVERMVGVNATIQVMHEAKGDQVYANITTIMAAMRGLTPLRPVDYVRVKDRPPRDGGPMQTANSSRAEAPATIYRTPQPGRVEAAIERAANAPDPYVSNVQSAVPALADGPDDLPF